MASGREPVLVLGASEAALARTVAAFFDAFSWDGTLDFETVTPAAFFEQF